MESKLYQDFTFAEYKEGFKKKNIWIGDDGCRALENYYIRNEKEAADEQCAECFASEQILSSARRADLLLSYPVQPQWLANQIGRHR